MLLDLFTVVNSNFDIENLMVFIWLGVFILSVIVEFATTELVSIWFIFSSVVTIVLACIPGIPYYVEVLVFILLSVLQIVFLRKILKKLFKTKDFKSNPDSMIGEKVLVVKDIKINEMGEIKYKGVIWSAVSLEDIIPEGEYVIIEHIEGNRLFVRKENR